MLSSESCYLWMVLTILILTIYTSLDTWVGGDLYLYWMLLSVRSNLYHIIYMVLHNLYYAVRETFYKFRLWVGQMIMLLKYANNGFSSGKLKLCMVNSWREWLKVVSLASVLSGCCMVVLRYQQRLRCGGCTRSGIGCASSVAPYLWDVCAFEL